MTQYVCQACSGRGGLVRWDLATDGQQPPVEVCPYCQGTGKVEPDAGPDTEGLGYAAP